MKKIFAITIFYLMLSTHIAYATQLFWGNVVEIMPDAGKLSIKIDDRTNLSEKVITIRLNDPAELRTLQIGQKIRLWVQQEQDGTFIAKRVCPCSDGTHDGTGVRTRLQTGAGYGRFSHGGSRGGR